MKLSRPVSAAVVTAAAFVVAAPGLSARWQGGGQATQAVLIKGRAPVSSEMLKVKLPRPVETDSANGIHLMVLEDHRAPQVTFQLIIPGAGGYFDPAAKVGLASMTATMMREGTTSRNTLKISEMLETTASSVGVSAGVASMLANLSGSSLTDNFTETFGLATDVLLNPTFPQEELDRYKTRTRGGLLSQRTNPTFLAAEMFQHVLYGTHPGSRVSITPEGLEAITRDDLVAFHKSHYVPDHAVLAMAGDITPAEARKLAEAQLGAWKKAGVAAPTVTDPAAMGPAHVSFVARPNSVQSSLWVGTQAINRNSPDFDIVAVMNAVIGGGPTGRLFTHLREEKGYTYGAYSNVAATQYTGNWNASLDVRTEVTEPALRDLIAEIARMRTEPVPQKEFDDRKRGIVAAFALSLESPAAVLNSHVTRYLYKLPVDYWDRLPERTAAVTQAEVQAAAKKYLDPSRLQLVIVGDPDKIGKLLGQFGPVETYDVNGKKITS